MKRAFQVFGIICCLLIGVGVATFLLGTGKGLWLSASTAFWLQLGIVMVDVLMLLGLITKVGGRKLGIGQSLLWGVGSATLIYSITTFIIMQQLSKASWEIVHGNIFLDYHLDFVIEMSAIAILPTLLGWWLWPKLFKMA